MDEENEINSSIPRKRRKLNEENEDEIESPDPPSTDDDYVSSVMTQSSDSDNIESENETDTEGRDDQSHGEGYDSDIDVADDENWKLVAQGWSEITKYISSSQMFKNIFGIKKKGKQKTKQMDVDNYLGKDWEWRTSLGYIKKLQFNSNDVALYLHRKNNYVTKWVNVKSK